MRNTFKKKVFPEFLLVFMVLASLTISSCQKATGNDSENVTGVWNGSSNCGNLPTVIVRGVGTSVTTELSVGATAACEKPIELIGTASGYTFTFNSQHFNDLCGNAFTVSGTGTVSDTTLTLTFSTTTAGNTTSCVFIGTK